MEINLKKLSEPLNENDIELRVGNVFKYGNKYGMQILCYKTARVDSHRLDEAVGALNWKNRFFHDKNNLLCCEISIYCSEKKEWVSKIDVGTESYTEKEKGLYSDAFKRAAFKWGIGTELYNMADIVIFDINQNDIKEKSNGNRTIYSYKKTLKKWKIKRNGENFEIYDDYNKKIFPSNNNFNNNNIELNENINQEKCNNVLNLMNYCAVKTNEFYSFLSKRYKRNIYKIEDILNSEYDEVIEILKLKSKVIEKDKNNGI